MEPQFLYIEPTFIRIYPTETKPIQDYEECENYPNCCDNHKQAFNDITTWFIGYITKNQDYLKLLKNGQIKAEEFKNWPLKILRSIDYTINFCEKRIDNADWFEDITNYIEYVSWCFGQPKIGYFAYEYFVKTNISDSPTMPEEKKQKLLKWFDDIHKESENKNLISKNNITQLHFIYQKWLKIFPFELDYLSHLKPQFTKTLPFLEGEIRNNPYTGMASAKIISSEKLINFLLELTKNILSAINGLKLYELNLINNVNQKQIEIINKERRLELEKLKSTAKSPERKFIGIAKQWLKGERKYFERIKPLLPANSPEKTISQNEISATSHPLFINNLIGNEKEKTALLKFLKEQYKNQKGKQIAIMIQALESIKRIAYNERSKLYVSLNQEFGEIGSDQSINKYMKEEKLRDTELAKSIELHAEKIKTHIENLPK